MQLEGKVAIVTGGGIGIGVAIALSFAREGADVVVAARTESALKEVASSIEAIGRRSLVVVTDLADPEQPQIIVDKALQEFGKIDILVNNAGIEGPLLDVAAMDLEGWNHTMAVNLTGAMLCTKYVLQKDMVPRQSGVIINVSSIAGKTGMVSRSAYSSSKWGMIGLTQSVAMEVGKYGIRVNCIAPGAVEGDRQTRILRRVSQASGRPLEELEAAVGARVALGRMVKAEEIAGVAVFLASEQSSGITGQTINCDAGLRMD